MKTRKRVTSFLLALAVAIALIITPSYDAQAATYIYAPTNIAQTAADGKKKQIVVRWDGAANAVSYNVIVRVGGSTGQICMSGNVKSNGATLNGVIPGVAYYIEVKSVAADGTVSNYSNTKTLYSVPAKPKNVVLYTWRPDTTNFSLDWTGYNKNQAGYFIPDGYEVKLTTLAGKNIGTFKTTSAYLSKTVAKAKNAGFKVKIRAYNIINEYSSTAPTFKTYSSWSDVKAFVPQPKMGATYKLRESTANLSWKPVKNARSYTIYGIKKVGNTYKYTKYKTVSGSTTSCKVPRSLGYVAVFPTVKVGGRAYKATYKDRIIYYLNIK